MHNSWPLIFALFGGKKNVYTQTLAEAFKCFSVWHWSDRVLLFDNNKKIASKLIFDKSAKAAVKHTAG